PPGATLPGGISLEEASRIAKTKVIAMRNINESEGVVEFNSVRFIDGLLCYTFLYYDNQQTLEEGGFDSEHVALDAMTGSVFYYADRAHGGFILFSDDNETRILPENAS
ncbi:MAG: hypothetical protein ACERKO_03035, partial [Acetanaerobacterium sp.]